MTALAHAHMDRAHCEITSWIIVVILSFIVKVHHWSAAVLLFILYFSVFCLTVSEFISVGFKSCCFAPGVIYKLCFKMQ